MVRLLTVALAMVALLSRAEAHQELYHNVDADLTEAAITGEVEISFTVHAPELLVGFEEASDAMFDDRWLRERSDEELERIQRLARVYLAERFGVRLGKADPVDLAGEVAFENFERIRGEGADALAPACVLATLRLRLPREATTLDVEHAADSDKRLILVVLRPKAFPEVIDVEAGARAVVALPEVHWGSAEGRWIYVAMVAGMLGVMIWLQVRRGKRLARRVEVLRVGR